MKQKVLDIIIELAKLLGIPLLLVIGQRFVLRKDNRLNSRKTQIELEVAEFERDNAASVIYRRQRYEALEDLKREIAVTDQLTNQNELLQATIAEYKMTIKSLQVKITLLETQLGFKK